MIINQTDFERFKKLNLKPKYSVGDELVFCLTTVNSKGEKTKRNDLVKVTEVYLRSDGNVKYKGNKLEESGYITNIGESMLKWSSYD